MTEISGKYGKSKAILGARAGYKMGSKRYLVYLIEPMSITRAQMNISYGGLLAGYNARIGKFESLRFTMLIGIGKISFAENGYGSGEHDDFFLLAEPGIDFVIEFSGYAGI